jgi:hypothetical protein
LVVSVRIARLIPIISPFKFNSGPPELPGLIAASVWIISPAEKKVPFVDSRNELKVRLLAETIPIVIVPERPKGFPMAITV